MRLRDWLLLALAAASSAAFAQLADQDPDWKELDTPPPPAFVLTRLVPFDVNTGSALKFGVDPGTFSIGTDGVVRYVVIAQSASGTVNAIYEGLRCATAEVRTYARHTPGAGWHAAGDSEWKPLSISPATRHSLMFARQGGCNGRSAPRSTEQIVRDLKNQDFEKLR